MKLYTNESQTAKLIELGCEKPRALVDKYYDFDAEDYKEVNHYSVGELVEILPTYCWYKYGDKAYRAQLKIFFALSRWHIAYRKFEDDHVGHLYGTQGDELIDALYDMIIVMNEEGII